MPGSERVGVDEAELQKKKIDYWVQSNLIAAGNQTKPRGNNFIYIYPLPARHNTFSHRQKDPNL